MAGDYVVILKAGEWTASQPLEVRMDPRLEADGVTQADLEAEELETADGRRAEQL